MKVNLFVKKARILFNELVQHSIVLGNQSADLDSIVSAITMSFFLTDGKTQFIPVINSSKEILKSKQECMLLFNHFAINLDDLVFLSEVKKGQICQVVLVDHNELDEQEKSLGISEKVIAVIDHHLDKNQFQNASPRLVDLSIGSNATLIAELFYKRQASDLTDSFASFLLFPILADTNNLTCRTSQKDLEMVEFLKGLSDLNCEQTYNSIEEAKYSQTDIDINVLLKKDYKQYTNDDGKVANWGMSSVNISVDELIQEKTRINEISEFMQEKNLYFFGILSIYKDKSSGDLKRDLGLFTWNEKLLNSFNETKEFGLEQKEETKDKNDGQYFYSIYRVSDVKLTRKYWQPVLESFLKRIKI